MGARSVVEWLSGGAGVQLKIIAATVDEFKVLERASAQVAPKGLSSVGK